SSTKHRVLNYSGPFNYSAINNFAVEQTDSPWLLFLNNDTEVIDGDWLATMAEHIQRPEVGAVGPRLLYPDDTVQHGGIVVGVGGIAGPRCSRTIRITTQIFLASAPISR